MTERQIDSKIHDIQDVKQRILDIFLKNVKSKKPQIDHRRNCDEGHWLETQMGVTKNNKNQPDLLGFELKKDSQLITFGDFGASEYIYKKKKTLLDELNHASIQMTRTQFLQYFGTPKNNRNSWSGACVPKIDKWNQCGQKLIVTENNDIHAVYSFTEDSRETKNALPEALKTPPQVVIAIWTSAKLKKLVDSKFNQKGFFICKKDAQGLYSELCFGKAFNFDHFMTSFKKGMIIFDSGMYQGNTRNYSLFRSSKKDFWNELLV
jgi:hypothetical protein